MKKAVIGFILGVALTVTGSAYAEEINNMIGKTIGGQFPVTISGQKLPVQAIVVEGTSYLPVRALGDALNLDVKFDADLGIELTEKEEATVTTQQTTITQEDQETITRVENQIALYQERIKETEARIAERNQRIAAYREHLSSETDALSIDATQKMIIEEEKLIVEDNKQIDEVNKIITDQQTYIEKIKAKYTTP